MSPGRSSARMSERAMPAPMWTMTGVWVMSAARTANCKGTTPFSPVMVLLMRTLTPTQVSG